MAKPRDKSRPFDPTTHALLVKMFILQAESIYWLRSTTNTLDRNMEALHKMLSEAPLHTDTCLARIRDALAVAVHHQHEVRTYEVTIMELCGVAGITLAQAKEMTAEAVSEGSKTIGTKAVSTYS